MKANSLYFLLLIILLGLSETAFSQGRDAYNWYFGQYAGITFQTGNPPAALLTGQANCPNQSGTTTMSDENGNLLFYSDGVTVWNKNHQIMVNGYGMGIHSTQCMALVNPGNGQEYYLFNFSSTGLQYSVINMSDNMGYIVPEKKGIILNVGNSWHLSAVQHPNQQESWLLTHAMGTNKFMAYLITAQGISIPVVSFAGINASGNEGYMKISPDGSRIAVSYIGDNTTQLFHFDNTTGIVSNQEVVTLPGSHGVEFSPNNLMLYTHGGGQALFQYNLTSNDPQIIASSGIMLSVQDFSPGALQLGPDGKIYVAHDGDYLSVIHNPNLGGLLCNFEYNSTYLGGRVCTQGLPSFNQSFLGEPSITATNLCSGQPTEFNFINFEGVDSVLWKFHDIANQPYDTSTLFNPSYTFSSPGTYFTQLTVYSGFIAKTIFKEIIINESPLPFLGHDTLFCHDATINLLLDAGPGEVYSWNASFPTDDRYFTVTDPGLYWVRVLNNGCSGYDTIMILKDNEPVLDESQLVISNSICGYLDGSISGLNFSVQGPYDIIWTDSSGVLIGTTVDVTGLAPGSYYATVNYGNNCSKTFGPYLISLSDILISYLQVTDSYCDLNVGTIHIIPVSGNPSEYSFSIDGGVNWIANSGFFTGLSAGVYECGIKKDQCMSIEPNPVIVNEITGPTISSISVTPENDTTKNGTITVIATGYGVLTYQLNGLLPQTSNTFTYLSAGDYILSVSDGSSCVTTVNVTVPRENSSAFDELQKPVYPITFPGIVTPDGDGFNDMFIPTADWQHIKSFNLAIYNIYGQLQFKTSNPAQTWKAQNAKEGIYTWLVIYEKSGKKAEMRGKVLVVK